MLRYRDCVSESVALLTIGTAATQAQMQFKDSMALSESALKGLEGRTQRESAALGGIDIIPIIKSERFKTAQFRITSFP